MRVKTSKQLFAFLSSQRGASLSGQEEEEEEEEAAAE